MKSINQKKGTSHTSIKVGDFTKCDKGTFMYGEETKKKKVLPTSKQIFIKKKVIMKKK